MLFFCRKEPQLLPPCSLLPLLDLSLVCGKALSSGSEIRTPNQPPKTSPWALLTDEKKEIQRSTNTSPWSRSNENIHECVSMMFKHTTEFGMIIALEGNQVIPGGPV